MPLQSIQTPNEKTSNKDQRTILNMIQYVKLPYAMSCFENSCSLELFSQRIENMIAGNDENKA